MNQYNFAILRPRMQRTPSIWNLFQLHWHTLNAVKAPDESFCDYLERARNDYHAAISGLPRGRKNALYARLLHARTKPAFDLFFYRFVRTVRRKNDEDQDEYRTRAVQTFIETHASMDEQAFEDFKNVLAAYYALN